MNKVIFLLVAMVLPFASRASDGRAWTKTDTAFEATFLLTLALDYGQTRTWISNPNVHEVNPILGREPSAGKVRVYFLACAVGHVAVARLLPNPYRRIWQAVWIGVEGVTVYNNTRLVGGLRLQF